MQHLHRGGTVEWMGSLVQWIFGCSCVGISALIVGSVFLGIGGISQPFSANTIAGITVLSVSALSFFLLYLGGITLIRANNPDVPPNQANEDEQI
jgi:hypothetical protein